MAISDEERKAVVEAVRTFMARERISRDEFARRTKLGKSTIDKLAIGLFSERTLLEIESRLNIKLRNRSPSTATAPAAYGGYSREEGAYFVGSYTFIRPCFHEAGVIHAFSMEIAWGADDILRLQEEMRTDEIAPQSARIHIPRGSNYLFIASNENGWLQTIIVTQLNILKRMQGMMITVGRAVGNAYIPVAVPVVLIKTTGTETRDLGRIAPRSPSYDSYRDELLAVETENFARWIAPE